MNCGASDEIVWGLISTGKCSFLTKCNGKKLCRNENNLTGICQKAACPLANSIYATVREENGKIFLFIKQPENKNQPIKLWKKVELSMNKEESLATISSNLSVYTNWIKQKCKKRYIMTCKYLKNKKSFKKQPETLIPLNRKVERQEKIRSEKALVASKLHKSIEKELKERLFNGYYGDAYNIDLTQIAENEISVEKSDTNSNAEYFVSGAEESDLELEIEELENLYSLNKEQVKIEKLSKSNPAKKEKLAN